jgi:hypothetical protein
MRLFIALGAVALMVCPPVWPQEFPVYDVEAFCDRVRDSFEDQRPEAKRMRRNYCIQEEQAAHDSARLYWPTAPDATQQECARMVRAHPDWPYGLLVRCLAARHERDRLQEDRPFRHW